MSPDPWTYGLIAVVLVANLWMIYYSYRAIDGAESPDHEPTDRPNESHVEYRADVVVCPHCKARNERGYQFCHNCVSELPGPSRAVGPISDTGTAVRA
jgi:hypothetical protein